MNSIRVMVVTVCMYVCNKYSVVLYVRFEDRSLAIEQEANIHTTDAVCDWYRTQGTKCSYQYKILRCPLSKWQTD
jgi:hypothetical protein